MSAAAISCRAAPGQLGDYLALTGLTIGAADALYAGLADCSCRPADGRPLGALASAPGAQLREPCARAPGRPAGAGELATHGADDRPLLRRCRRWPRSWPALEARRRRLARADLAALRQRSPLMLHVMHELVRRAPRHEPGRRPAHGARPGAPLFPPATWGRAKWWKACARWRSTRTTRRSGTRPHRGGDAGDGGAFFVSPWPAHAHPLRASGVTQNGLAARQRSRGPLRPGACACMRSSIDSSRGQPGVQATPLSAPHLLTA